MLHVSLPVSLKTLLVLQTVPGDKPRKTLKRSIFRPLEFLKNLMKKREEENKQIEENMIKVQTEVHRETPRRPTTDRKQQELAQMLVTQDRFSMNVENIDVDVEVLSPKAKKSLTTKIAKDVVHKFMAQQVPQVTPWAQPQVVHPVAPKAQSPIVCHIQP